MSKSVKCSCRNCGAPLNPTDTKCPKCGKDLGEVGRNIRVLINESLNLADKRLLQNPPELAHLLPPILSDANFVPFTYITEKYFMLAVVERNQQKQLKKLVKQRIEPFPNLIKPDNVSGSSTFRINNSKNMFIGNCTVRNSFTLSLGKDSTVVLYNHTQITETQQGTKKYIIPLAYVISFGDVIGHYNLTDFLEDLMAYSTKQWKQEYGKPVQGT